MMRLVLIVLAAGTLAACGRVGPPRPPGPVEAITYPRAYPAPTAVEREEMDARRAAAGLPPVPRTATGLPLPPPRTAR